MPPNRRQLTRADLPDELTAKTLRRLPLATLRRLSRPGNGVLTAAEQASFDAALHEVMSETARRVSRQINRADVARVLRDANARRSGAGAGRRPSRSDEQLRRLALRIGEQVDLAEGLAPDVDWSFAQSALEPSTKPSTKATTEPSTEPATQEAATGPATQELTTDDDDDATVSDLEQRLTDQVELVQVMSEIADVSKRSYALEQERDLQNTRGVFFGFVVSVAVIMAGWAPLVAARDWPERMRTIGLTLATCLVAGVVYALVRLWQRRHLADEAQPDPDES